RIRRLRHPCSTSIPAVARHRKRLGKHADGLSALWRSKQLEYTWLRSLMGRHSDFRQVTRDALDYAFDQFGVEDSALAEALMSAYQQLSCYPEVPRVLAQLKNHGLKLAILSNGTPAMLEAAVSNAGLADLIDPLLSVEAVGIYKPDPRVYQLAVDRLGVPPQSISFQSSNAWDAAGAASFGFRVAWINRFGQRRERLPARPDAELNDLTALPGLLGF
ncbi:MAG: haloacid dehalogenase type II, partial [Candidatus Competibacteraceae bacterium]|nr:haloacid dehalogenase type II [Candidatus Competibacteraceae bacterium]